MSQLLHLSLNTQDSRLTAEYEHHEVQLSPECPCSVCPHAPPSLHVNMALPVRWGVTTTTTKTTTTTTTTALRGPPPSNLTPPICLTAEYEHHEVQQLPLDVLH